MKKILYSSLLLSIIQSILFWHKSPGISVTVFLAIIILVIYYNLNDKQKMKNKKGMLLGVPIILLGLTYFIFNNIFFQIINIPVIFALIIMMCIKTTEGKISENKFIRNIIGKVFRPLYVIVEFIGDFQINEFLEEKKKIKNEKIEFVKKLGKSMLIAIPVIIIIIVLLSSADSIFGSLFTNISEWISNIFSSESISDTVARVIWIIIIFVYVSGFLVAFVKKEDSLDIVTHKKRTFSSFTINTLLICLDAIYCIFSIIQFKYLFMNAGKTAGFDYAEYARTGFFQLMFVSFINFALIKSKNVQNDKLNKILKILLIIFTMIIVISAIFRMHLYEQEYGYTYLRIFVYFILATEILILIPSLVNISGKEFDVFDTSLKIIITMYVILNFINIDYIIAKNNIDRYLNDPENNNIDIYYITAFTGTDSVNELIRLLEKDESVLSYERREYMQNVKAKVRSHLRTYKLYSEWENFEWQEWNMSKLNSYKVLKNIDLKGEF